jgi:hypothetical protein
VSVDIYEVSKINIRLGKQNLSIVAAKYQFKMQEDIA